MIKTSCNKFLLSWICRYTHLLPFSSAKELEELSLEVSDFNTMDEDELPDSIRQSAKLNNGGRLRLDVIWGHLQDLLIPDGRMRFPRLFRIALLVLTIPHSNAGEERVFSMIKKNVTATRSCLDQEKTLGSILTIKMESVNYPDGVSLPPNVFVAAKGATKKYNKAH